MTAVMETVLSGAFSPILEDGEVCRWDVQNWQHVCGFHTMHDSHGMRATFRRMPIDDAVGQRLDMLDLWVDSTYAVHVDGGEGDLGCDVLRELIRPMVCEYIRQRVLSYNLSRVSVRTRSRYGYEMDAPIESLDDIKKALEGDATSRLFIDGKEVRTMAPFHEPLSTPGFQSVQASDVFIFGRHPSSGIFYKELAKD